MVYHHCIRCEKQIRKYARKIGHGTIYIRTFLQAEHGLCEEELDNGYLCGPCFSFIYGSVHHCGPGRNKTDPSNAKRASSDSVAAAAAAVQAASSEAKKKKKNGDGSTQSKSQSHSFNINEGRIFLFYFHHDHVFGPPSPV